MFQLIKSFGRGGAETLLLAMFGARDEKRFRFTFGYFLHWKNQVADELRVQGAEVHCFDADGNLGMLRRIFSVSSYLKKQQIDILHCHLPWAGLVGRVAGWMAGVKVVYTEHNKQERYHFVTRWLNRVTFSWQGCAIAVSQEVAASISTNISSRLPVHVVTNGVDLSLYFKDKRVRDESRATHGIEEGCLVIGLVAVFRVQKRLRLWLETAAAVKPKLHRVKFMLVGDGPCRQEVEDTIRSLSLSEFVLLPGLQKDPRPYYACFDLFLMTSEFEGLPVALLEAMAMEIPVVATNAGGTGEVINHEKEGLLFPVASNAEELATACASLLSDEKRRTAYGRHARQRISEQFSIDRMMRRIEDIYEDQLARG